MVGKSSRFCTFYITCLHKSPKVMIQPTIKKMTMTDIVKIALLKEYTWTWSTLLKEYMEYMNLIYYTCTYRIYISTATENKQPLIKIQNLIHRVKANNTEGSRKKNIKAFTTWCKNCKHEPLQKTASGTSNHPKPDQMQLVTSPSS